MTYNLNWNIFNSGYKDYCVLRCDTCNLIVKCNVSKKNSACISFLVDGYRGLLQNTNKNPSTYLPTKLHGVTSQQFPSQSLMWQPQIPQYCIHPTKCHWSFITKAWGISKHSNDSTARVKLLIMLSLDGFTIAGKLKCPMVCNMIMCNTKFSRR